MKKTIIALLLVFALVLPMAALAEEHEPVTIEAWIVQTDFSDAWDEQIKPKFEEEYPWITVDAVGVGDSRKPLDIQHAHSGVIQGLAENELGLGTEGGFELLVRGVLIDECNVDAELFHRHAEEVERASVDA